MAPERHHYKADAQQQTPWRATGPPARGMHLPP